jgi:glycogen(starch) synthase
MLAFNAERYRKSRTVMLDRNLTVSTVISTYNRAASLDTTLQALRRLNYPHFEVIVVNGPSTDETREVLDRHRTRIRAGRCSDQNLSVSRNVGIEMARGDLVAFLDDDAVPDEDWLNDAVNAFDSDEVGGAGGFVYDHTGYNLQYRYSVSNRLGTARWNVPGPATEFCYPGCQEFPYLQGTNAIFRRVALLEIGGFDEEFNYYLDETDVCLRLIDAGYLLKQLSNAFVYHRFLPSHVRNANRVVTAWHPVVKNKVYFSLKNALPEKPFRDLLKDCERFCAEAEANLKFHVEAGNATQEKLTEFYRDVDAALREGVQTGLARPRRLLHSDTARGLRGPVGTDVLDEPNRGRFKLHPTVLPKSEKLTVCYLSQQYPPGVVGGVGRLTYDIACGLAGRGHNVHVLTRSSTGFNTVDFEDGVWVHRLVLDQAESPSPSGVVVPPEVWQFSARLLRELRRIHVTHPIDITEGPIWDVEGIAAVLDGSFRVVTNLETPMKIVVETNPELVDRSPEGEKRYLEFYAAETLLMQRSTAVRAISHAIVETMQTSYGIEFRPGQLSVFPLGMEDRSQGKTDEKQNDFIDVLFAGRFEGRKGIDVLLKTIPPLCLKFPKARFIMVGEDRVMADGKTRGGAFRARNARAPFRDRVIFPGAVPDKELERYLAQCDIFVSPSRYESFGLVFLEAMMFGKPTVGCRAGGMKEVIVDGVTGLLAEPGNSASLQATLASLLADPGKRQALGKAGRERFLEHYTREKFTGHTLEFYRQILSDSSRSEPVLSLNRAG